METIISKPRQIKATTRRFLKDLLRQKWQLITVIICLTLSTVCTLASPMLMGQAIDQIATGISRAAKTGAHFSVSVKTLGTIVLALLAAYLLSALFSYFSQLILASVAQRLTLMLRKRISDKLNRLPLNYYDNHQTGDTLSRVTNDLERIADTLQESLEQAFTSIIMIIGAFGLMFMISPSLTLIALLTIIASIVAATIVSSKTNRYYADNQAALGKLNANIEEAFTGDQVIKAFNLQPEVIQTNNELNARLQKAATKAQFVTYAINPLIRFMSTLGYVVIAVRGALLVIDGRITIGDIQAVFQYVNQVSEPVTELAYTMNTLQGAVASAERVYEIEDALEESADDKTPVSVHRPVSGNVAFKHVRFGYEEGQILMQDINFTAKVGSKIAIVGPTGAGKTTLINLLMRFYELQGGQITIDGVDIKTMRRSELHSLFGMVLQETWLFNGSIADNIAYGRPDATLAEIKAAAKAARVDHFINTLSQGYDTILNGDQTAVSVGQKQLLTIARTILADPKILILDEATSSVDTRTEIEIQKAMDKLMQGRTSFVIAHRLSTIKDADLILVMNEGTIIEQGTHQSLLQQNGFYADLYRSQFAVKTTGA
ncbi:multidrug ABC transporter ATP-binding and permease protein [Secundilactobacillus pentosiphilus]|uniref:Multidrug ABC transporter ATP-binding and permease protein n=1 Tax=Secundilactobacillus pentosiphilus TaxID=1714682 RepID=A0A1Z5IW04_9LACO|nr:ABC transporter ATP-binding protein [Secundilactobacillus pentosiphilus]GAX05964.1 multidrug ABC transporter ATP-binding and permease protein [Secundilactobacillus pentosiphilus]